MFETSTFLLQEGSSVESIEKEVNHYLEDPTYEAIGEINNEYCSLFKKFIHHNYKNDIINDRFIKIDEYEMYKSIDAFNSFYELFKEENCLKQVISNTFDNNDEYVFTYNGSNSDEFVENYNRNYNTHYEMANEILIKYDIKSHKFMNCTDNNSWKNLTDLGKHTLNSKKPINGNYLINNKNLSYSSYDFTNKSKNKKKSKSVDTKEEV